MSKTAFLVIDMQFGNFEGDDPIVDGPELLKRVADLLSTAQAKDVPVYFVLNHGGTGDPDEYGTPGWYLHPKLTPSENDVIINKSTPDAFHETRLQEKLEEKGVTELVVAGLQTEYCVDTTCRRAALLLTF